ncbi:MAG TPA: dihydrolipoamide acetyltransferase family protein [Spirillospora sp.]|nr:dihydrolipoamide acetyltransferase family protein [Spirillospora sp.]
MPVPVYLPRFDPSHKSSTILRWLVSEGAAVREGDPVCEVTSDKVDMEIEAPADGTLAGVQYPVGAEVPAATVIAYVLAEGESTADLPQPAAAAPAKSGATDGSRISPVARRIAEERQIALDTVTGTGPGGRITRRDVETALPAPPGKVRATPAARRLAREFDVPLENISGSGPRGRVQGTDVQALVDQRQAAISQSGATTKPQVIKLEGMRRAIAARMQHSSQTAPHIFVEVQVDGSRIEQLRSAIKARGERLSVTALLVKACAWALQRHPRLNATLEDDVLSLWPKPHIGVAVALDDGLIVPVIHAAQAHSLRQTQTAVDDLAARARSGSLRPDDLAGGTFTISNLGMFAVDRFTAIINPPQVAILAAGRMARQFVPNEHDQPTLCPVMNLVLSVDHRAADGADAARFLADLKAVLEEPDLMLW